jgi:hypothetical protein
LGTVAAYGDMARIENEVMSTWSTGKRTLIIVVRKQTTLSRLRMPFIYPKVYDVAEIGITG